MTVIEGEGIRAVNEIKNIDITVVRIRTAIKSRASRRCVHASCAVGHERSNRYLFPCTVTIFCVLILFWCISLNCRGPPSFMSTIEELLGRESSGSGIENREYNRRDPLCWPRNTLYEQKLALISSTSGGRSVGIVRSRTKVTEFVFCLFVQWIVAYYLKNWFYDKYLCVLFEGDDVKRWTQCIILQHRNYRRMQEKLKRQRRDLHPQSPKMFD
jgi:hypothetical protein